MPSESLRRPMPDGTLISAHLHRPDASAPVPCIIQYTPYRKGPLGAPPPIVAHGYAHLTFDIRGTGDSGGWNDSIYSLAEQADGVEVIEWAGRQPWCNGNVGIWGISFGGVVAMQMAGHAPPSLKAVIVRAGSDDPWRWWTNPGGSPRPYLYLNYAAIMAAANFSPPDPEVVGPDWWDLWEERIERNVPWGVSFIKNLSDGPFWRERALRGKYDQVKAAVFVVDGWADWYPTPLLQTFAALPGPKRALIGPWSHQWPETGIPGPRIDWLSEALKWWDRWLKGIDNGVEDELPVTLFVREHSAPATVLMDDRGTFRCEDAWPPARVTERSLYLGAEGRLLDSPPLDAGADGYHNDPRIGACSGFHGGGPFNINWAMPLDQRPDEIGSLVYTTEPLAADLEVIGEPRVALHLSTDMPVAMVAVKLCDVAPDGVSVMVTKGFQTSAERAHSDPLPCASGGEPGWGSPARPAPAENPPPGLPPLAQGEEPDPTPAHQLPLLACAWRFRAGHRIRLMLAGADLMNVWPTPHLGSVNVHHSPAQPSALVLPVAPAREVPLSEPGLRPSPHPPARREELAAPELSQSRDLIRDTASVAYTQGYTSRWGNQARYTVSARKPAEAVAEGNSRASWSYGGREIVVEAHCMTTSDARAFHHTTQVEIIVDGRPFRSRSWAVSVPREGI